MIGAIEAMTSAPREAATEWFHRSPSDSPYSGSARRNEGPRQDATAKDTTGPMPTRTMASRTVPMGMSDALAAELATRNRRAVSAWS